MIIRVVKYYEAIREYDVEVPDDTPDDQMEDAVDKATLVFKGEGVDWYDPITTQAFHVDKDGDVIDDVDPIFES